MKKTTIIIGICTLMLLMGCSSGYVSKDYNDTVLLKGMIDSCEKEFCKATKTYDTEEYLKVLCDCFGEQVIQSYNKKTRFYYVYLDRQGVQERK